MRLNALTHGNKDLYTNINRNLYTSVQCTRHAVIILLAVLGAALVVITPQYEQLTDECAGKFRPRSPLVWPAEQ